MAHESDTAIRGEIARLIQVASEMGEVDHYAGKRSATRVSDGVPLEAILDPTGVSGSWSVAMNDVSEVGVSFWSKRQVRQHTTMYIREYREDVGIWIPVFVKHSTAGLRGKLIGTTFKMESETIQPPAGSL